MIYNVFLKTKLVDEYEFIYVVCHDKNKNNIESIDISDFDLIITQPIYDQTAAKQTLGILKRKKKDCIVIVIPSLYFHFYFPNLIYLKVDKSGLNETIRAPGGKIDQLVLPIAYHDKNLLDLHLKYKKDKKTIISKYKEALFSDKFYSEDAYLKYYQKSISNLEERFLNYSELYKDFHPIYFIPITNYIKKNYRDGLLWHSNIHPKYNPVLKFVCHEIVSILNKNTNLPINFYSGDYENQLPLYQSISSLVNFNTAQYAFARVNKKELEIDDFVDIYLKVYGDEKNAKYLKANRTW